MIDLIDSINSVNFNNMIERKTSIVNKVNKKK
jgi:hypothetical protein